MDDEKNITTDTIADALINMHESLGLCDHDTAVGFKTSKKKDILKSSDDKSFNRLFQEIVKRQNKKK